MNSISPTISSISEGPRQSNFELLRIVAMLLVLIVHADFLSIGTPSLMDSFEKPLNFWTRTGIESLSIVCVNVFVLISGWFGIRQKRSGFFKFIFQCLYFSIGIYLFNLFIGNARISPAGIINCLFVDDGLWFVRAYMLLYLIAPILNTFIEHQSSKTVRNILLMFFAYQTFYGWTGWDYTFNFGYSTLSFIGLYLLARYLRKYNPLQHSKSVWGGVFISCILINSLIFFITIWSGNNIVRPYAYNNPIIIIQSIALLQLFKCLKIKYNRYINWISASAFAVYLLHINTMTITLYKTAVSDIYCGYDGIRCITGIFIFILSVFGIAVLIDQPRKLLWNFLNKHIGSK